jgi:hypothetical protein
METETSIKSLNPLLKERLFSSGNAEREKKTGRCGDLPIDFGYC